LQSRPTVTIGIPARNAANCLIETVRGIQQQTFEDFELLVEDDASTDDTESLCRELAAHDPRVRYGRSEAPCGFPSTANRLIGNARGRFFKLCSQDEPLRPAFLARCVAEFQAAPATVVLVYPRRELLGPDGRSLGVYEDRLDLRMGSPALRVGLLVWRLRMSNLLHGLIRTETLLQTSCFLPEAGSDSVLLVELALRGEFREIPEVLYERRLREGPASGLAGFEAVPSKHFYALQLASRQAAAIRDAPLGPSQRLAAALFLVPAFGAARARDWAWRAIRPLRALRHWLRDQVRGVLRRFGRAA
jgi:glycosyltransferase involved in cell wall biosynthesis